MDDFGFQREAQAERRVGREAFITLALVTSAFWIINATSILIEDARSGAATVWLEPVLLEAIPAAAIIALFPAVQAFERRTPIGPTPLLIALPAHLAASAVFAVILIAWMHVSRSLLWPPLFGEEMNLLSDGALNVFVYEYRKVATGYFGAVAFLYLFRAMEQARMEAEAARAEARDTNRVTLKCGGRVMRLPADEFRTAKAAGNYVEARFGEGRHLARLTLTELESLLREAGVDAVRVHRSWMVNRAEVQTIAPTGEGDVTLTLADGGSVPGSRRYRDRLDAA